MPSSEIPNPFMGDLQGRGPAPLGGRPPMPSDDVKMQAELVDVVAREVVVSRLHYPVGGTPQEPRIFECYRLAEPGLIGCGRDVEQARGALQSIEHASRAAANADSPRPNAAARVAECYGSPMVPMEPPEAREVLLATRALFEHPDEAHDLDRCIDLVERQRAALAQKDALLRECDEVLAEVRRQSEPETGSLVGDLLRRVRTALPADSPREGS